MVAVEFLAEMDEVLREELAQSLTQWTSEVVGLLGIVAKPTKVVFNNYFLISETGTGGFADTGKVLVLAFDLDYQDRIAQMKNLRASFYHESYHIAQNWLGDVVLPAIDEAILEGAATVFERDRALASPLWGAYGAREDMLRLFDLAINLTNDYDQGKWKFYDEESGQKWMLYRIGVFIIDETLKRHPELSIEQIALMSAQEILKRSGL
jgi:hypothetical protein